MSNYLLTFSPTGGTLKTAEILASAITDNWEHIDLLQPIPKMNFTGEDVCLVAVPSFGGRIPTTAAERLQMLSANGAKAVLLCVYGNRAYEDTLSELNDVLALCGFQCIAAAAAIAEHSIIREFGTGRPDAEDRSELTGFAEKIRERLLKPAEYPLYVPGKHGAYKSYQNSPFVPAENTSCSNCGICAAACPTGAIGNTPDEIDAVRCIKCMRCTAVCPGGTRKLDEKMYAALRERLAAVCSTQKANELFL